MKFSICVHELMIGIFRWFAPGVHHRSDSDPANGRAHPRLRALVRIALLSPPACLRSPPPHPWSFAELRIRYTATGRMARPASALIRNKQSNDAIRWAVGDRELQLLVS